MSLLNQPKTYARLPQQLPQPQLQQIPSHSLLYVLEAEEDNLTQQLQEIAEAKSRESNLRQRLSIVQSSLSALRALDAAPEPTQEQAPTPAPKIKNIRKAATKKAGIPTESSIASEPVSEDTETVHNDFAVFPS